MDYFGWEANSVFDLCSSYWFVNAQTLLWGTALLFYGCHLDFTFGGCSSDLQILSCQQVREQGLMSIYARSFLLSLHVLIWLLCCLRPWVRIHSRCIDFSGERLLSSRIAKGVFVFQGNPCSWGFGDRRSLTCCLLFEVSQLSRVSWTSDSNLHW